MKQVRIVLKAMNGNVTPDFPNFRGVDPSGRSGIYAEQLPNSRIGAIIEIDDTDAPVAGVWPTTILRAKYKLAANWTPPEIVPDA